MRLVSSFSDTFAPRVFLCGHCGGKQLLPASASICYCSSTYLTQLVCTTCNSHTLPSILFFHTITTTVRSLSNMSIITPAMIAVSLPQGSHCDILSRPPAVLTTLASSIAVGLLVSYLPQHIKIIRRGSSEGLSPWYVGLGALSSICAIANILVLPASREDMACCKVISGGACFAALLGVIQIGMQWSCFMFM